MKITLLSTIVLLSSLCLHAQTEDQLSKSNFESNCATDFYTVTTSGEIQRWSLNNGAITGGDTVLTNSGVGIAYCGDPLSPTFYSTSHPNTGISYHDNTLGWIDYPSAQTFTNAGGYEYDIFLYGLVGGDNKAIYHFDGSTYTLVEDVNPSYLSTYDVAVDDQGHAWIFKGTGSTATTSLSTYDINGVLATYSISFNSESTYGSFFLNNTLYVAFGTTSGGAFSDAIVPILIDGSTASFGNPIPFANNSYADMASCQGSSGPANVSEILTESLIVYPNPTNGLVTFEFDELTDAKKITIHDNTGRLVYSDDEIENVLNYSLNLSKEQTGVYHYSIELSDHIIKGKVVLE